MPFPGSENQIFGEKGNKCNELVCNSPTLELVYLVSCIKNRFCDKIISKLFVQFPILRQNQELNSKYYAKIGNYIPYFTFD